MGVNGRQLARAHELWRMRVCKLLAHATAQERARAERNGWPAVRSMIWLASERNPEWASNPQQVMEAIINGIEGKP